MLRVTVRTVDGGLLEIDQGEELLDRLRQLRAEGLTGKRLVDKLITDDWGAPPVSIQIKGKLADGSTVDEQICYD